MKKYGFLLFIPLISILVTSCSKDEPADSDYIPLPLKTEREKAGGETTVFLTSSNAFKSPAPNLSATDFETHANGDAHFESAFVTAPAEVNGGVGPIFNNTSCVSCHISDGRAGFPSNLNGLSGFFFRVSLPGKNEVGGPVPVPGYGTQIQNQAIFGYKPEAKFAVAYTSITETFADGTKVTLQKPNYSIIDPYIDLPSGILLSPRMAPPVFGLGLLEAIPESTILANQDIDDADGDGISGKANYVYDVESGETKLGRFGWKANTTTVLEQCVGAYNEDMGITSFYLPNETGYGQTNGEDGLEDDPEVSKEIIDDVVFYCKTLGVPAARNIDDPAVIKGEKLFEQISCAKCHIPEMKTGNSNISILANQTIYPYSDMLLHDMGEELADNRPDFLANGREWKTRPLWGIGLTQVVNGHTDYLHDGRAKNITEAILWHGGEALDSKNKFEALSKGDRENVLAFINSL